MSALDPLDGAAAILVAAVGRAEGARPAAAALACAGADSAYAALLVDVGGRPPRPTLIAAAPARELEERLVAHLPQARVAARGQICQLAVEPDGEGFEQAASALTVARGGAAVVFAAPGQVQPLLADPLGQRLKGALLRADLGAERALTALAVAGLAASGLRIAVLKKRLAWVAERRALFGTLAPDGGGGLPEALVARLLGVGRGPLSTGRGTDSSVAAAGVPGGG